MSGTTQEQEAANERRLRDVFNAHARDAGGEKRMGVDELAAALAALGSQVKGGKAGLKELLEKVDADRSGDLSHSEFRTLFEAARLRAVFEKIDVDGSGQISQQEMVRALGALGIRATRSEAAQMVKAVDRDNNEEISWPEFYAAFQLVPLASLQSVANKWSALAMVDAGSDLAPLLPNPDLKIWQTVVAGGCAGVMSRSITAPLERVRLAAQTGNMEGGSMGTVLGRIYAKEGVRGLFRGNLANCIRVFPTGAITLTTYLNLLKLTPADKHMDAMEPVYRVMCAGTAAAVGNTLTYPLDVVRARMTLVGAGGARYSGIMDALRCIHVQEGIKGLYKGIRPTLIAVVPFVAVQQTTVDVTKGLAAEAGWSPPTPPLLMMCGATAGLLAQTIVYPLDVLRRRMQLGPGANGHVAADKTWLALQSVVRREGFVTLFAGIVPTYVKAIPTAMMGATVCVSLVEHFKSANKAQHPA